MNDFQNARLTWVVFGHCDQDDLVDGKCGKCGAEYIKWVDRVVRQQAAGEADACKSTHFDASATGPCWCGDESH